MELLLIGCYVGLMAMGLLWVIYRIIVFVRTQRDRDSRWSGQMTEAELAAFIEEFKRNNPQKVKAQNPGCQDAVQGSSGSAGAPLPTVSATDSE